jgi:hypothetical protein
MPKPVREIALLVQIMTTSTCARRTLNYNLRRIVDLTSWEGSLWCGREDKIRLPSLFAMNFLFISLNRERINCSK